MVVPYCSREEVDYSTAKFRQLLSAAEEINEETEQVMLLIARRTVSFYGSTDRTWYDVGLPILDIYSISSDGNPLAAEIDAGVIRIPGGVLSGSPVVADVLAGFGSRTIGHNLAADIGVHTTDLGFNGRAGEAAMLGSEIVYWAIDGPDVVRNAFGTPSAHVAGTEVWDLHPPPTLQSVSADVTVRVAQTEQRQTRRPDTMPPSVQKRLNGYRRPATFPISESSGGAGAAHIAPTPTNPTLVLEIAERVLSLIDAGDGLKVTLGGGRLVIALAISVLEEAYIVQAEAARPLEAVWLASAAHVERNNTAEIEELPGQTRADNSGGYLWIASSVELAFIGFAGSGNQLGAFARRVDVVIDGSNFVTYRSGQDLTNLAAINLPILIGIEA